MVLLAEVVQTFILADFCYYYVKRWAHSPPSEPCPLKITDGQLPTEVDSPSLWQRHVWRPPAEVPLVCLKLGAGLQMPPRKRSANVSQSNLQLSMFAYR